MFKKSMILLMALFLCSTCTWAMDVGGIDMPDTFKAGDTSLILNGAGLRKKFGLKIYGIGLYLKTKSGNASTILNSDEPMAMQMKWNMSVSSTRLDDTYYEIFATVLKAPKQDTYGPKSDYGPMTNQVVTFMNAVDKRETTKKDTWIFIYIPGKGTEVHIHDGIKDQLMCTLPGLDFKTVLFSIWLGDTPVGENLKNALLGIQ